MNPLKRSSPSYLEVIDMEASVSAVAQLLQYQFKNRKLLEEALTHSSYTESPSYQRLEFLGDMALGLAVSNFLFLAYPDLDPGQLSVLRAANISTEKLARVAVRHRLYRYIRHNTTLDEKITEFRLAVQEEDKTEFYGGAIKAPKILADIVESIAASVYVDCGFDLKELWLVFRGLLEPIITLDVLQNQPQPVTMLFELCQQLGKMIDIRHMKNGDRNIVNIYVDGAHIASSSSEQKENAKLNAAKVALQKLAYKKVNDKFRFEFDGTKGNDGAKQKLYELCGKKKWPKPTYSVEKKMGPSHDRKFVCSVEIASANGMIFTVGNERSRVLFATGDKKLRIRDAENSAAHSMLCGLKDANVI